MKTFIIAALTADGFIGRDASHLSLEWSSPEDKKLYRQTTTEAGIMVMGSHTFDTIGRALPGRKTIVYTSRPEAYAGIENVEATSKQPAELLAQLEGEGYAQVAICGGSTIYTQFLQAGVVDELRVTIEPVLFGKGLPLFNVELEIKLELSEIKQLNPNTFQLIYKVLE